MQTIPLFQHVQQAGRDPQVVLDLTDTLATDFQQTPDRVSWLYFYPRHMTDLKSALSSAEFGGIGGEL